MQLNPFLVTYALDFTKTVTAHVLAENADTAGQRVKEALEQGTLWDVGDDTLYLVNEDWEECDGQVPEFEVAPAREVDSQVDHSVQVMRLHDNAWALLEAAQCVLDQWASGNLAEAVRMLDAAVEMCQRTR